MSAAGLAVEYLLRAAALVPTKRPALVAPTAFHWNAASFLNIVFLLLFTGLWWLARTQQRLGGRAGYAIAPVCGVETVNGAARLDYEGETFYFCADRCKQRFASDPARYRRSAQPAAY